MSSIRLARRLQSNSRAALQRRTTLQSSSSAALQRRPELAGAGYVRRQWRAFWLCLVLAGPYLLQPSDRTARSGCGVLRQPLPT